MPNPSKSAVRNSAKSKLSEAGRRLGPGNDFEPWDPQADRGLIVHARQL